MDDASRSLERVVLLGPVEGERSWWLAFEISYWQG